MNKLPTFSTNEAAKPRVSLSCQFLTNLWFLCLKSRKAGCFGHFFRSHFCEASVCTNLVVSSPINLPCAGPTVPPARCRGWGLPAGGGLLGPSRAAPSRPQKEKLVAGGDSCHISLPHLSSDGRGPVSCRRELSMSPLCDRVKQGGRRARTSVTHTCRDAAPAAQLDTSRSVSLHLTAVHLSPHL